MLDVTPVHTWYRMSAPSSGYGFDDGSLTFFEHRDYIEEAMVLADAAVDFSEFDAVYVTPSADTVLTFGAAFDAYAGTGISVDGTEIRNAVTFGEWIRTALPNYGALSLVHETGHLLGLPDLYDLSDTGWPQTHRFAGAWDPMGELWPGGHFIAWHKEKLGWISESQILCLNDPGVTDVALTQLSSSGGLKAVVVPTGASTALVAELRTADGLDANLCDEGVLVYRVDTSVLTGAGPITVVSPNDGADPATILDCSLLYDAPLDLGPGESPTYTDPSGVSFRVLTTGASSYTVRVTVP
jgi:M6 family metalloprotease-like protein